MTRSVCGSVRPEDFLMQCASGFIKNERLGEISTCPQVGTERVPQMQREGIPWFENPFGVAHRAFDNVVSLRGAAKFPERVAEVAISVENIGIIGTGDLGPMLDEYVRRTTDRR